MRRIAVLGVVLCSATAGAQPVTLERVIVIGRASDRAVWTDAATEARLDQDPQLAAIVIGKRGKQRVVLGPAGIAKAKLAGKTVRVELVDAERLVIEPLSGQSPATIDVLRWNQK